VILEGACWVGLPPFRVLFYRFPRKRWNWDATRAFIWQRCTQGQSRNIKWSIREAAGGFAMIVRLALDRASDRTGRLTEIGPLWAPTRFWRVSLAAARQRAGQGVPFVTRTLPT